MSQSNTNLVPDTVVFPGNCIDEQNTWSEKCIRFVMENSDEGDVTFLVGQKEEEIKTFKFCLRVASPVLRRAFSTDWDNSSSIWLPDIEPKAFRQFLKLIFTDKIHKSTIKSLDLPLDEIFNILYISKKYDVAGITKAVFDFLNEQTTVKNAIYVYENVADFDDDRIFFHFIKEKFDRIIKEEEFYQVSIEVLAEFLKLDELRVNEIDLFKALCNWGRYQFNKQNEKEEDDISGENLRNVLGHLLPLIRFPLFSTRDFVNEVPKGLLSLEEAHSTLTYIVLSKEKKKSMLKENEFPFNVQRRSKPIIEFKTVLFPAKPEMRFVFDSKSEFMVDIVANRKIRVHSFSFHGPARSCNYKVSINVIKLTKEEKEIPIHCFKENVAALKKKCFSINSSVIVKRNNVDNRIRFSIKLEGGYHLPSSCLKSYTDENIQLYYNFGHSGPLAEFQYEEIE